MPTHTYPYLYTHTYPYLPIPTHTYPCLPMPTHAYQYLPIRVTQQPSKQAQAFASSAIPERESCKKKLPEASPGAIERVLKLLKDKAARHRSARRPVHRAQAGGQAGVRAVGLGRHAPQPRCGDS